ncbi:MAG TPA: YdeI/OmpD-associated family protein [Vicinamibacterales bacterium]|nr:YdeI/OmpD-associated family protein [Vicinamibacterales bacterium]
MPKRDPRVDAYIANAADFAKPLLTHFRAVVDEACPDAVETIKWSTPSWQYAGSSLCSMSAFKQHCSFGFWRANLLTLNGKPLGFGADGQLSHVTSKKDLPPRPVLVALVKQAAKLNADGVKTSVMSGARSRRPAKPVTVPADFRRALATNKEARDTFDSFSPSQRREYVEWISEAKQEATRAKRLAASVEWLAEGKPRNWKYMK